MNNEWSKIGWVLLALLWAIPELVCLIFTWGKGSRIGNHIYYKLFPEEKPE